MKVLMSIKPKYVEKIFSGEKEWEFRRTAPQPFCRNAIYWKAGKNPFSVVIYASAPIKKVVGEMMINYTHYDRAENLWRFCDGKAGISLEELRQYFRNASWESYDSGWGMHIGWVRKYETPLSLKEAKFVQKASFQFVEKPPQNFCYIRDFDFIK